MTKIIAEIGLNHLGNSKKLIKMIKFISNCNVNGITVQIQSDEYYDGSKPFRKKINENWIAINYIGIKNNSYNWQ